MGDRALETLPAGVHVFEYDRAQARDGGPLRTRVDVPPAGLT